MTPKKVSWVEPSFPLPDDAHPGAAMRLDRIRGMLALYARQTKDLGKMLRAELNTGVFIDERYFEGDQPYESLVEPNIREILAVIEGIDLRASRTKRRLGMTAYTAFVREAEANSELEPE